MPQPKKQVPSSKVLTSRLLKDIRFLIDSARSQVARSVNSTLVMLNWHIGRRIRKDVLGNARAEYGRQIVGALSRQLSAEYGRGFSRPSLFHRLHFARAFPNREIVSTLSRQLGWSHFLEIIYLGDSLRRDFYAEMCRIEKWSVRTLRQKVQGMLFERTAFSRKPAQLAKQELRALREEDKLSPDLVFRDPYFLDFLKLKGAYHEKDVEAAILRQLEAFLLEIGTDFTFLDRQKRMTIGRDDFYLDLLFYHRRLRRLVAIELKLGKFRPADKGQMELYLRWLDKYEKRPGEEAPIGLILCTEKDTEQIALLELDHGEIRVAAYLTELPPRKVLQRKLHEASLLARKELEMRND